MRKLTIETFQNGVIDSTISVPLELAKLASGTMLSNVSPAHAEMITQAIDDDTFTGVILEIEEHQSHERTVFSIV